MKYLDALRVAKLLTRMKTTFSPILYRPSDIRSMR